MLNKPDFSDLYKFLTSIGLVFIVSAFLIPWLFMNDGVGITITKEEYNSLIEESKNLTAKRINLNTIVVDTLPWISISLFTIGLVVVTYGVYKWKGKQNNIDETELLNLTELRTKIKHLTTSEIIQKADNEIISEVSIDTSSSLDILSQEGKVNEISPEDHTQMRNNLFKIEELFFKKIIDFNSFDFLPSSNVSIDSKYNVDILLQAFHVKKNPDVLINIKLLQKKLNIQSVYDTYENIKWAHNSYVINSGRKAKIKLVIVYNDNIAEDEEIRRFLIACEEYQNRLNKQIVSLFVLPESQAESFDISEIFI